MTEQKQVEKFEPFEAVWPNVAEAKNIFSAIGTMVEEATFEIAHDGLTFRAMDPSHVCLIDLKIASNEFTKWNYKGNPKKITLRIEDFLKFLNTAKKGAEKRSMVIGLENESDPLELVIHGENGKYDKDFKINLLESSQSSTPLPKLTFDAYFIVQPGLMSNGEAILNDLNTISNHVTISTGRNQVYFKAKGDTGKLEIRLNEEQKMKSEITGNEKEPIQSTYSLEYLIKFFKAMDAFKEAQCYCEYSSKMPMRITLNLENPTEAISNPRSYLAFYVAPRVQE